MKEQSQNENISGFYAKDPLIQDASITEKNFSSGSGKNIIELSEIIGTDEVRSLINAFYDLLHIPMAIIDAKGEVLAGVGWQGICTKFHRVHPETCKFCVESDTVLSAGVPEGEFRLYKCKNGMWDVSTPIMVEGQHVGNVFTGQFFFQDEDIDYGFFRIQAEKYGFDEKKYVEMLDEVPRIKREDVNKTMNFLIKLAQLLSRLGYNNISLAKSLTERDALMDSIKQGRERLDLAVAAANAGSWELDILTGKRVWSDKLWKILWLEPGSIEPSRELLSKIIHPDDLEKYDRAINDAIQKGKEINFEWRILVDQGRIRYLQTFGRTIFDDDNKPIRLLGITIDISGRKRAEDIILSEKENLQKIFDSVNVGMLLIDENGVVRRVNETVSKMLGKDISRHIGISQPGNLLDCAHLTGESDICGNTPYCLSCPIRQTFESVLKSGEPKHNVEFNTNLSIAEGRINAWFDLSAEPIRLEGIKYVILSLNNITERRKKEEELKKLNRTLNAISNSDQLIMHASQTDEKEYLESVCKIVIEDCGYAMVWVGYSEDNEKKSVKPVAFAGFEDGYLDSLDISWGDNEHGQGPTGIAVRTGKPSICKNMQTDPKFKPWREQAMKRGYNSSIVYPLKIENKIIGAISIYSKEPDPFTEDEKYLLGKLTDDISYGIANLRFRMEKGRSETALRISEERFRDLFENSPISVWEEDFSSVKKRIDELKYYGVSDLGGYFLNNPDEVKKLVSLVKVIDVNQKSLELFEIDSKDGVIEDLASHFDEKSLEIFCEEIIALDEGKRKFSRETSYLARDGQEKILIISLSVSSKFFDTWSRVLVSFFDITERKKAENEFSRLASFPILNPNPITEIGLDDRINMMNPAAKRMFPDLDEKMFDHTWLSGWNEVKKDFLDNKLNLKYRDVKVGDAFFQQSMHFNRDSQSIRIYGTDITDRVLAEEEKNKFIAVMSHELRNPLTPIMSGSQFVRAYLEKNMKQGQPVDEVVNEAVKTIEQQSKNMARLLDDLLDITRISRGNIQLKKRVIDLNDTFMNSIKATRPIFENQNHVFSYIHPKTPLYTEADPVRLEQVFINLLNNAAKYTQSRGRIWFEMRRQENEAEIIVRDNGMGIDPGKIGLIFDLFTRLSTPYATTLGELGIGLKLSKDLIFLHGGSIKPVSAGLNKGSEFIVRLPIFPENYIDTVAPDDDTAFSDNLLKRILVVDDNVSITKLFSEMFKFLGHETREVHDGISALALAKEYRPQIVLVDIGLPGMSGYELARELRKLEQASKNKMKLIAVTGYGHDDDKRKAFDAGFDMHLIKPVDFTTLQSAISIDLT
jgi:signal transduction histidine kinase/ligand-binding sensor protein/ActR/RegA family two-component response regulator/putative methionine-R-sulfoxide reductase with GAF domain